MLLANVLYKIRNNRWASSIHDIFTVVTGVVVVDDVVEVDWRIVVVVDGTFLKVLYDKEATSTNRMILNFQRTDNFILERTINVNGIFRKPEKFYMNIKLQCKNRNLELINSHRSKKRTRNTCQQSTKSRKKRTSRAIAKLDLFGSREEKFIFFKQKLFQTFLS